MSEDKVRNFFHENARLFTVLGVFGAISVYFTQLSLESRWRRLGIVSSLTIFIVVALTIQRNLPPEDSDREPFDYVVNNPREYRLAFFYLAFWAVVLSVLAVIVSFSGTFAFLIQFLFIIIGIFLITKWVGLVEIAEEGESLTLGEDPEFLLFAAYVMRNAIWGGTVGGGTLAMLWVWGYLPIGQLLQFQNKSIWTAPIYGVLGGLTIGGSIYTLFALLTMIVHGMLAWVIKHELEDEFSETMRVLYGWGESKDEESEDEDA